jgi:hypothetical protein
MSDWLVERANNGDTESGLMWKCEKCGRKNLSTGEKQ